MEKAVLIIHLLVEGSSVRTIERVTGVGKATILRLLNFAGAQCERLMNERIRDVPVNFIEADEIWGFVGKKEGRKRATELHNKKIGDAYCFVAIEANTKLVVCSALGRRDLATASRFTEKLRRAARGRFQLTTDGLRAYLDAVEMSFGSEIDFAQLVKEYRSDSGGRAERRYSPGDFVRATKVYIAGDPDAERVSTSFVERQNLTMRMMMRRLTRLTNALSKKWENLENALALHFAYYNFCRVHQTLQVTPAMEAGITDHVWSLTELLRT
jgi:IS1 family transposase